MKKSVLCTMGAKSPVIEKENAELEWMVVTAIRDPTGLLYDLETVFTKHIHFLAHSDSIHLHKVIKKIYICDDSKIRLKRSIGFLL